MEELVKKLTGKNRQDFEYAASEIINNSDVQTFSELVDKLNNQRKIIEARHIDDLSWEETCEEIALTRNPATIHYNAGLDRLLTFKKVQKTVTAYRKELEKIQSKK